MKNIKRCNLISTELRKVNYISVLLLTIIFTIGLSTQNVNAQKLLFPDEFKKLPESDPGATVTANVLPNTGGKIFYGQIGNQNVVWIDGEPEILNFPGRILETNSDFTYVKGVVTDNERYYVFKDEEYTYIDVNYASGYSDLNVAYFSDDGQLIIGTARKSDGTYTRVRAVRITGGNWQVIGDDPPLSEFGSSSVGAVCGENGSIIIGDKYFDGISQGFRLENGTFQYFSHQGLIYGRVASPNGNVIAGHASDTGLNNYVPYKWQNGQITILGELQDGLDLGYHFSTSVNNEGNVISGYAEVFGSGYRGNMAFIWIEGRGLIKYNDYIFDEYKLVLPGDRITMAELSEDQTYISGTVGYANNSERSFILLLKETDDRIVINSTGDRPLNIANNTDCTTGEQIEVNGEMVAECTLRAAIQTAINRYNEESEKSGNISFQIPGTEAQIIAVISPLPEISAPIEIDGSDQITNLGLPLVYIDGQSAGGGVNGFNIMHDSVTIKNLAIYGFDGHGIYVADVEDIRLEGLIVGTDANGTEGIGNGGDGIHISGNAKVNLGGEISENSPLASEGFGTGVALLGNSGHGIAIVSPETSENSNDLKSGNKAPYNFQTAEKPAILLKNLSVGLLKISENATAAIENMGAGAYVNGRNITFSNSAFGPSGGSGMEIIASEAVHVLHQTSFGKNKSEISEEADIAHSKPENLNPIIMVKRSKGVMIGSPDSAEEPVEAIGSRGHFMEIEESEDVQVANLISGAVKNIGNISSSIIQQMKNIQGGIRINNSERITIGSIGLPTVITNSGDTESNTASGIFATGAMTKNIKIVAAKVGGIAGLAATGIAGDGIRIENGVSDFTIGGEDEEEAVIVAGNTGYGLHIANNNENTFSSEEARKVISSVINLFTDVTEPGNMDTQLPNLSGAVKVSNSMNIVFKKMSIGPTDGHGMEISGNLSRSISILQSSVGSINNLISHAASQIAGPKGDGIHITDASDIQIGDDTAENRVQVHGSLGKGISIIQGRAIQLVNVSVGDIIKENIAGDISEALAKAGNLLGGVLIEGSDSVMVKNSRISNNGSLISSAIGGISAKISDNIKIYANYIGNTSETGPASGNLGAGITAEDVRKLLLGANVISGNYIGIDASQTYIQMDGNIIEKQTGGNGVSGHGVSMNGGYLNAIRNFIENNQGIGINLEEVNAATILLNNILSNYNEGMLSTIREIKSAGENGSLVYARENWWGDASGPGGQGPGTGDAVNGNVDYSNWLSAPVGLAIVPQEHLISLKSDQQYILPVSVANHLDASDQLNITITDSLGWYSGNSTFSVPVENFEYNNISLAFNPSGSQSNINMVKIKAVSQSNQDLTSEVKIYFVPDSNIINLENPSLAETNTLNTESGPFQIGDEIIIGHGLANEEKGIIADFGSIILENPLKFSHAPGERIFTISNLYTSVNEIIAKIPETQKTILGNNYPNPFSGSTKIPFEITETGKVEVLIIDNLGRTLKSLVNQTLPAGKHEVTFEGTTLPEGMYFYQFRGNGFSETRKMIKTR